MGKFDGVLLVTDYDATFAVGSRVPRDNLEMLEYFKAEGGRFTVATGRAHFTFRAVRDLIPFNAPVVLANGAVIYDFEQEKALREAPLPPTVVADMAELARIRKKMSLEVYHGVDDVYVWNPNLYTARHLLHLKGNAHVCPIEEMPFPWDKAIMEQDHKTLLSLQSDILERWGDRYEAIFSADFMLELNAKGCTKGSGVLALARELSIEQKNIYCVGDNENDISMLEIAAIPFAPANAIPAVKAVPGVVMLPKCEDGTIGALIRRLDAIY